MSYYETMYIAHPALEGGRLKDLILLVEKFMNQLGGKTRTIDVWGKKKLAYPINKEKYGVYVLFQFENKGSHNKEFNLELEHNPNILAYLTTSIDEDQFLTDVPNLDTQLGLSQPEQTEENNSQSLEEDNSGNSSKDTVASTKAGEVSDEPSQEASPDNLDDNIKEEE